MSDEQTQHKVIETTIEVNESKENTESVIDDSIDETIEPQTTWIMG